MAAKQVERRLAAILAVDVAGYSRLMGEDEAGTARSVREHREAARPIVQAHGGRIVKTMGDGVLLEFPSVVAAVECAIAVQRLMAGRNADVPEARRIVYRIGINLGDVLIEGDDILGDGVNIAARLEALAEPGGICLSDFAYQQVRGKIDAAFVDLGERELKNIARPVRVYSIYPQSNSATPAKAGDHSSDASTGASVDTGLRRYGVEGEKANSPPRLSIVVLPFANIGGDPEQEYFVDGVTESLTTDLSRISGSFVIARNTAFTYKGKPIDVKQIGHELNVRYVLEGSVQRGGNRMRVNVQLIDAETGNHLWAERFDKPVADLFDMQDEIVARLANALNVELTAAEARRAERAPHPDSMDLTFRAWAMHNKGAATMTEARELFLAALALDPKNVEALAGLAVVDGRMILMHLGPARVELLDEAENAARKALTLAPRHAMALYALGFVYTYSKRQEEAISLFEQALAVNPNFAGAHASVGLAKGFTGRGEDMEAHANGALRLSPRDVYAAPWCAGVGVSAILRGCDEEAIPWLRRAIDFDRSYANPYFYLAAALTRLNRLAESQKALRDGLALNPDFTIARLRSASGSASDSPIFMAQLERLYDGLRQAGMPEG